MPTPKISYSNSNLQFNSSRSWWVNLSCIQPLISEVWDFSHLTHTPSAFRKQVSWAWPQTQASQPTPTRACNHRWVPLSQTSHRISAVTQCTLSPCTSLLPHRRTPSSPKARKVIMSFSQLRMSSTSCTNSSNNNRWLSGAITKMIRHNWRAHLPLLEEILSSQICARSYTQVVGEVAHLGSIRARVSSEEATTLCSTGLHPRRTCASMIWATLLAIGMESINKSRLSLVQMQWVLLVRGGLSRSIRWWPARSRYIAETSRYHRIIHLQSKT